ncbi:serine hydrolase [Liquorilactobacillus vini]|uniref:serine-type D-Ala-D-Ala carboxypeptidase n=1 Tax=Liquorilactobacillus vini DSM 20605 TaxID=1133569 RepID=A0A0R2C8H1_9LACO|nr:serine hydrolase [Liquorilactobacillus vini]KRM87690.1 D-alanyl-d-alanine carboxypeptidase [Liquorilactobacillus vini DSM 20605]
MFKKTKKFLISLVTAVMTFATIGATGGAVSSAKATTINDTSTSNLSLDVKGAIAIDAKTGQVLYSKNANQSLPIASMTKLISIYLVLQAIKKGKLSWNQKVSVDSASYKVSQDTSLSNVPLLKNHKYTVRQLYQASLIYSANGAVMTLANAVAGSQKAFVDQMRALLKSWGIKDAEINTVSGLPNGEVGSAKYPGVADSAENKLSAAEMALVAQKLLKAYPEVLQTTKIARMKFNNGTTETEMENWNWMLKGLAKAYTELPVDGLKTGTSDSAGADFTGTVHKDGHRIITVVLGAQHKNQEDTSRFVQTQKLMSYVYNNFTYTKIKANQSYKGANSLPVYHGKQLTAKAVTGQSTEIWLKRGLSSNNLKAKLTGNKKLYQKNGLAAPIAKNKQIGTLNLTVKGQKLQYLDGSASLQVKAISTQTIQKANVFVIMGRSIKNFFTNLF